MSRPGGPSARLHGARRILVGAEALLTRLLGRSLTFDVLRALAVRVAGMLSALALYLVLARGLPVAQFGLYALVLGWLNLLSMLATLGTDGAALRFLPEYRVRGTPELAAGYLRFAAQIALGVGIPLAALSILFVHWRFDAATSNVAAVMLLAIPFVALVAQRQSTLRVSGSVVFSVLPEQVLRPLLAALFVLLVGALLPPLDAVHAGAALLAATLASFLVGNALLARAELPWRGAAPAYQRGPWLRTAVRLGLFGWGYAVLRQLDLLLVGALLDAERAAHYAVASRCADIALFVALAVDVLIAPLVAERNAQGDRLALAQVIRRGVRLAATLTLPAVLVLALISPWVLPLFGPAYRAGLPAFLVLIAGHALAVSAGYGTYLLTMTGRESRALLILALALAVDATLCVLLIPSMHLVGAALAAAAGALTWRLGTAYAAWRLLGINALPLGPLLAAGAADIAARDAAVTDAGTDARGPR